MGSISAQPLSLRDFIQHAFPSAIAACLFVPFFPHLSQRVSAEGLIIASFILGYLVSSPVTTIATFVTEKLPMVRAKLKSYQAEARWHANNWSYANLFYSINKDDKDYLYLTGSYIEFYRMIGVYLLAYGFLNFIRLIRAGLSAATWSDAGTAVLKLTTPMLGDWTMRTSIVIVLSVVLASYAFRDFLIEFRELFLDDGQYVTMAATYHRANGNIAKSIWCRVLRGADGLAGIEVTLAANGTTIDFTETDEQGRFQFPGTYAQCLATTCAITLDGEAASRTLALDEKKVPYFEFQIAPVAKAEPAFASNVAQIEVQQANLTSPRASPIIILLR